MPHLIIEHSSDIKSSSIKNLCVEIQNIMAGVEGNFDKDQCKCRTHSFDDYLVGTPDQSEASFLHITLKALSGRSIEVRKNLAEKIAAFSQNFIIECKLQTKRCDLSVDIVEMDRNTYQKIRLGS